MPFLMSEAPLYVSSALPLGLNPVGVTQVGVQHLGATHRGTSLIRNNDFAAYRGTSLIRNLAHKKQPPLRNLQ